MEIEHKYGTSIASKDDFLAHLDFEIRQISEEQTRGGWTKWALYGVVASCCWLFFDQLDKGEAKTDTVALLLLLFSIAAQFILHIQRVLPSAKNRSFGILRFRKASDSGSIKALYLQVLWQILVLILALSFAGRVSWTQAAATIAYYSLPVFYGPLALVAHYFYDPEIVHPDKETKSPKEHYAFWILALSGLAWGFTGYLRALLASYPESVPSSNYRIASLLIVVAYSVYLLVDQTRKAPLLAFLIEIRREIAFDRIELASAVRQTEIAIVGASVDESLQEDVLKILSVLSEQEAQFERFSKLDVLSKEFLSDADQITEKEIDKACEILVATRSQVQEVIEKTDERENLKRRLQTHINLVDDETRETVRAAKEVILQIEDFSAKSTAKAQGLTSQMIEMMERLDRAKPAAVEQ